MSAMSRLTASISLGLGGVRSLEAVGDRVEGVEADRAPWMWPRKAAPCPSGVLLQISVALLLVPNVFAIAADLGAMADVLSLLVGGPRLLYVLLFGSLCVIL